MPRKKKSAPTKKKDIIATHVVVTAVSATTADPDVTNDSTNTVNSTRLAVGCATQEGYVFDEVNEQCNIMMLHKAFNSPKGYVFIEERENEEPAAIGQHSSAVFGKQKE
jgi:hypothetical protein